MPRRRVAVSDETEGKTESTPLNMDYVVGGSIDSEALLHEKMVETSQGESSNSFMPEDVHAVKSEKDLVEEELFKEDVVQQQSNDCMELFEEKDEFEEEKALGEEFIESVVDQKELAITQAEEQEEVLKQVALAQKVSAKDEILSRGIFTASKHEKKVLYNDDYVIPLRDEVQYVTPGTERKKEYLHLVESQRGGKIVTGLVTGTSVLDGHLCAVVKYGTYFRVFIPYEMFIEERESDKEYLASHPKAADKESYRRLLLNRRIMSEVYFLVMNIDEKEGIATGNRIAAMNRMIQNYYYGKDPRSNEYILNVGSKLEARIVDATAVSLTVEARGIECRLYPEDISHTRIPDVSREYPVGTTVPVKITKLERLEKTGRTRRMPRPAVRVSIKEALPDFRRRLFDLYREDTLLSAEVTGIAENGIYCRLEDSNGKMDALCNFSGNNKGFMPDDTLPTVGSKVLIRIMSKDAENLRIYARLVRTLREA